MGLDIVPPNAFADGVHKPDDLLGPGVAAGGVAAGGSPKVSRALTCDEGVVEGAPTDKGCGAPYR